MWNVASLPPDVTGADVHVWCASIDHPAAVVRALSEVLSADEQERAGRFRFERDRGRFIVARAVLREILGQCVGRDPRKLSFQYGRYGKPELAAESGAGHIAFNVSHSQDRALFAVARGRKVGIDLEFIKPLDDLRLMAERCFSARVNAELRSLPADRVVAGFYAHWTRKEALHKAIGHGLSAPPDESDVPVGANEGDHWSLIGLDPYPDFAAALAVEGRNWRLRTWRWPL